MIRVEPVAITSSANNAINFKVEYQYDYQGRRVRATKYLWSTTNNAWASTPAYDRKFIYDRWNVVLEVDVRSGANAVIRRYIWGLDLSGQNGVASRAGMHGAGGVGGLLAVRQEAMGNQDGVGALSAADYVYQYDANGNVSELINVADGSVAAHYEYDPFGGGLNPPSSPSAIWKANPFRFSTKYTDATGLYDFGRRFYSAATGRWLNRDPIEEAGGVNLYGFVRNAATMLFDILGLADPSHSIDCRRCHGDVERPWAPAGSVCADPTIAFCGAGLGTCGNAAGEMIQTARYWCPLNEEDVWNRAFNPPPDTPTVRCVIHQGGRCLRGAGGAAQIVGGVCAGVTGGLSIPGGILIFNGIDELQAAWGDCNSKKYEVGQAVAWRCGGGKTAQAWTGFCFDIGGNLIAAGAQFLPGRGPTGPVPVPPAVPAGPVATGGDTVCLSASAALTGDCSAACAAAEWAQAANEFSVVCHGDSVSAWVLRGGEWVELSHRSFATWLRSSGYTGGPVRLYMCEVGQLSDGFAQNLANKLGECVIAPTERLYLFPSGECVIQSAAGTPGTWRPFLPGGSP